MKKKAILLILLVCISSILCSCGVREELLKDEESDQMLEAMVNAIIAQDKESVYNMMVDEVKNSGDFDKGYNEIISMWQGDTYTYEHLARKVNTSIYNGETTKLVDSEYKVSTNVNTYVVQLTRFERGNESAVGSFHVDTYEDAVANGGTNQAVGYITDIFKFNLIQWALLGFSLLMYAFDITVFVDCAIHKVKLKPLWLIGILLVYFSASLSIMPDKFNIWANITIPTYSRLLIYTTGGFKIAGYIPIVAIAYLIFRRKLIKKI